MTEQEFADMFERYSKTRRGIEFLTDYFQKMLKHCVIEHSESEYFGVQHTMDFYNTVDCMVKDFEVEESKRVI